jgi:serine phosphatase RsbU (regulator of sigma subunit)
VIALAVLALPLTLQTIFLYYQEYNQSIEEVRRVLDVIAEGSETYVQDRIERDWKILGAVAVKPIELGDDLTVYKIRNPGSSEDRFVTMDYLGKNLQIGIHTPDGKAIAFLLPLSELYETLEAFDKAPYPISLALLGSDNAPLIGRVVNDAITSKIALQNTPLTLCLSVPLSAIRDSYERELLFRSLILLGSILVVGGLLLAILTRRMTKPMRHLCDTMARVSEGATHCRYRPDWMGFEINTLGAQFNDTLNAVEHHQAAAAKERIEREKWAQEMRLGHEIQKSLFPEHIPDLGHLEIAARYTPALEVSGDFYDFFLIDDHRLFLAIADTAGKGISACIYSLGVRGALRALGRAKHSLSEMILRANQLLIDDTKHSGMFITLWAGVYDMKTRALTYTNHGHLPTLLVREGAIEELTTPGIALGATHLDTVPTKKITLRPHDRLLLYTDGVIEAHNPQNHLYSGERLKGQLLTHNTLGSHALLNALFQDVHSFTKDAPLHDDLTAAILYLS